MAETMPTRSGEGDRLAGCPGQRSRSSPVSPRSLAKRRHSGRLHCCPRPARHHDLGFHRPGVSRDAGYRPPTVILTDRDAGDADPLGDDRPAHAGAAGQRPGQVAVSSNG